jgi:hypothetical protein
VAVTMKNVVFLDVTPCDSCENRPFGETLPVINLLLTANVVPNPLILFTLMMEAMRSSETSHLTRTTWRHIPEDGILHVSNSNCL